MNQFQYHKALLFSKILRKGNSYIINKFRHEGMIVGENTHIFSNISPSEPYLITIGNNCTISTDVNFITHDASVGLFMGREKFSDLCGRIKIGDNCFIGNRSIILYGVTLPDKTLVAAGSVVTKTFEEPGCIIGGNPARIIGRIDKFLKENETSLLSLHGLSPEDRKNIILKSKFLIKK